MNKLCLIAAILLFAICIPAQTAKPPEEDKKETKEIVQTQNVVPATNKVEISTKETKKPKIVLPPEKANPVKIPKIETALTIDGNPDEEIWKTAAVFKDFYQTGPGDNIAPSKQTEVLMMYDEKNLYFAFKCWDEKDKIRATVAKRDDVFGEDNVRLWLDTYNDQRRAYVLGFNPLGIQQDGISTEGRGADFSARSSIHSISISARETGFRGSVRHIWIFSADI
ncbi:MAG: carbohydrate binding family 9 domain-containing protein [Pyrinomonadaceae bacterium]